MRTQQRKGLCPPTTRPLYQCILQFEALSSCRKQGTDERKFVLEFSSAAERLGYNEVALNDLFNNALDEPLTWWRMRGQDHLNVSRYVPQLRWLVCHRWWAMKLQCLRWRPTKEEEKEQGFLHPSRSGGCSRARSSPGAHRVRSRARSAPGPHRVCTRVCSGPGAYRVRSRVRFTARSGPGAQRVRSGAHRIHSRARSSQVVVICSTLVASCTDGPALASCPAGCALVSCSACPPMALCSACPTLAPVCLFLQALFHSMDLAHCPCPRSASGPSPSKTFFFFSVVLHRVRVMFDCATFLSLSACFLLIFVLFYY